MYSYNIYNWHNYTHLIGGTPSAKDTIPKIRVIRKTAQGNKTIIIDGKALLNKEREADLVLQANDVMIIK